MSTPSSSHPNILWVSFEDTGPHYGCYGDPVARTPHLDQLAAEGCRWTNAFSTSGVCAPSRSAIITGMYAISIGTQHMRTTHTEAGFEALPTPYSAVIPPHVKCFTEYLRAAGYYCTNNQKTDYQFDPPLTAWDELGADAHWRNRPSPQQPFFSVFNLEASHESGMWEKAEEEPPHINPADIPLPPYFPDTPKVRASMARMYANIERNDAILGQILAQLEKDGLADNTIVFHWSDHGPLPRGKRWPYDSGIRIPMIVRVPKTMLTTCGLKAGSVREALVSSIDLAPTVLSLARLPIPCHMQGQPFFGANQAPERSYIHASRDRHDCTYDRVRAVRDKRFKYLRNYYPHSDPSSWYSYLNRHPIMQELWRLHLGGELSPLAESLFFPTSRAPEELYDTEVDPFETHNLAADPAFAAERQRLATALDNWLRDVGDMGAIPEAEMVQRWYPDGVQPHTAPPVAICITPESPGLEPLATQSEHNIELPARLILQSPTQGASIAYRYDSGANNRWQLYTRPLPLRSGSSKITTQAFRIGYADSEQVTLGFNATPAL